MFQFGIYFCLKVGEKKGKEDSSAQCGFSGQNLPKPTWKAFMVFRDILLIAGRINQSPMMSSLSSADKVFQAKQTKHISYKSYYLKIHGEAHLKFLIVHFSI